MAKAAEAFRTISEAADELDVPQHVLRHWEEVFGQVRPMRRAGGRRYYRPLDIDLLRGIRVLLYNQRYTTKGVQKIFREEGVKFVSELGRRAAAGEEIDVRPVLSDEEGVKQEVMELGDDARVPPEMSRDVRHALSRLVTRLEKVQDALDEAALALEAIDAAEGDDVDGEDEAPLALGDGAAA